jgi:mevalonate kinase
VGRFNTACQLPSFKKQMELLAAKSKECIQQYINSEDIFKTLGEISSLQSRFLDFLIVPSLKEIWQKGLEKQSYFIKICGAGGGGTYLMFSREKMDRWESGDFKLEEVSL